MRAALDANPGRLANEIVITGQSQGSGSSIGASRIAKDYAPELRLRATIATGVIPSFPDGPYKLQRTSPGKGAPSRFTVLRLIGGSLPDGGPGPDKLMSEKGQRLLQIGRESCVDEMRGFEQQNGLDASNAFSVDPAKLETMMSPVTDMTLVRLPAPVFLGTGLADRTVPPRRQFAAAAALCVAGNAVTWKSYPGITHNGIVNAAFDDEFEFVQRVFENQPASSNCAILAEPGMPGTPQAGIRFND